MGLPLVTGSGLFCARCYSGVALRASTLAASAAVLMLAAAIGAAHPSVGVLVDRTTALRVE
jgi:hypothetical protein